MSTIHHGVVVLAPPGTVGSRQVVWVVLLLLLILAVLLFGAPAVRGVLGHLLGLIAIAIIAISGFVAFRNTHIEDGELIFIGYSVAIVVGITLFFLFRRNRPRNLSPRIRELLELRRAAVARTGRRHCTEALAIDEELNRLGYDFASDPIDRLI